MKKTEQEVLRTAANLLEKQGWCQGQLISDSGELCLVGALHVAACPDIPEEQPRQRYLHGDLANAIWGNRNVEDRCYAAARRVEAIVGQVDGSEYGTIVAWNNAKGRTQEEVIRVLREAASADT